MKESHAKERGEMDLLFTAQSLGISLQGLQTRVWGLGLAVYCLGLEPYRALNPKPLG